MTLAFALANATDEQLAAITATQYAVLLNAEAKKVAEAVGSHAFFELVEDASHWGSDIYDIHSGLDLARYLLAQDYWDLYKDVHGVRPRGQYNRIRNLSRDGIQAEIDDLLKVLDQCGLDEDAVELEAQKSLTYQPFAGIQGR